MWIIPKQLHTSASAPDTKELVLDSEEFSQICERSLTWRGKDSLSRTWLQRWKRENWMQHLCSRTLKPSLTESFVDAWTSSVVASRANHSVLLESVKALKTQDTSSHTSLTESGTANLELFSSKTLKESSQPRQQTESQFSSMSSESWKDWVTEQRREYSQRLKSEHLTRESGSSSLAWPTASVAGCVEGGVVSNVEMTLTGFKATRESGTSYGAKLRDAVETYEKKNWATPNTMDYMAQRSPEALQRQFETTRKGRTQPANLREQVHPKNWPTATARDWKGCGNATTRKDGKHRMDNLEAVIKYGHPDQANPSTTGKSQGSQQWATPRANKVHPVITEENREHLANRNKSNLEEEIAGHCGKAQGKLNPDWVEQLMGLPVGWTDLGSWATE